MHTLRVMVVRKGEVVPGVEPVMLAASQTVIGSHFDHGVSPYRHLTP